MKNALLCFESNTGVPTLEGKPLVVSGLSCYPVDPPKA